MKKTILTAALMAMTASPAFAIGNCEKPSRVSIPADVASMPLTEFTQIRAKGESYLANARSYLSCLNQIIYNYAPEDPIVSKAGKAHQEYASEWAPIWGELNLACINWEASHGSQFPGGCQPTNPAG